MAHVLLWLADHINKGAPGMLIPATSRKIVASLIVLSLAVVAFACARAAQDQSSQDRASQNRSTAPRSTAPFDAVADAQTPRPVPTTRPEQQLSDHDKSADFSADAAKSSSTVFKDQPDEGKVKGFDFYRDPLNAMRPNQPPGEITQQDIADKPKVMAAQRKLLESRYNLTPRTDPQVKMSRGKPICIGPTARLPEGMTWEKLADMSPDQVRQAGTFPYPPLPHPKQATGGQVFPQVQIDQFPRLAALRRRFRSPDAFLPEFPPAIFLQSRPELGDVSRGEVVSINNYYRLFKDLLTPVQLDGLRMLLTPLPQEEFNPTDDRKSMQPSLGVTCLDCHVNGHTTAQFHLNPDDRPQNRRFRLDTVSLRGVSQQQIHGSKRSLRSVEDFTEFEQRTAYFNGDQVHAFKKGAMILDRVQVSHMAQMQNMFDFPPAPKLDPMTNRLDPGKADRGRAARREAVPRQGPVRQLPHAVRVLHGSSDARPARRALHPGTRRRPDQDVHATRHQGEPAVPARRAMPDAGGYGGVLQPGAGD
jgi:hypothetical protein